MDDIVWIRDDAQVDDSIPVSDQLPSGDDPSTTATATQPAEEEPETFTEIPVIFQPKSTEVRFYPTDESKDNEPPPAPTPEIKQEAAQPDAEPQKQEPKPIETNQPSKPSTAAEPAVINLQFKEPPQKKEEPQKSPEIKEPAAASTAAEPAVISIVYKEPPKQKPSSEGAPVQVEVFSPLDHPAELDKIVEEAAEEPVLIDHNTPEILEEAAQKL
ncbi:hypothetical protein TELCIR_21665, partial [Teladorsagia circumcincta]